MKPYQMLSQFYHYHWEQYAVDYVGLLSELQAISPGSVALDLGCGTGHVSAMLAAEGMRVIGYDLSNEMIDLARERNIDAKLDIQFIQGDMRNFELEEAAALVLIAYDALNYLIQPSDVQRLFERIYENLSPGGMLVFDVNTPAIYRAYHGVTEKVYVEGGHIRQMTRYRWWNGMGITKFELDMGDPRSVAEEIHVQRAYRIPVIRRMLRRAGFQDVASFDDFHCNPSGIFSQKPIFAALK